MINKDKFKKAIGGFLVILGLIFIYESYTLYKNYCELFTLKLNLPYAGFELRRFDLEFLFSIFLILNGYHFCKPESVLKKIISNYVIFSSVYLIIIINFLFIKNSHIYLTPQFFYKILLSLSIVLSLWSSENFNFIKRLNKKILVFLYFVKNINFNNYIIIRIY